MRKALLLLMLILGAVLVAGSPFDSTYHHLLESAPVHEELPPVFFASYFDGLVKESILVGEEMGEVEEEVKEEMEGEIEEEVVVIKKEVEERVEDVIPEIVEVLITKKGFEPKEVTIKVGQTVVWKNEQARVKALINGLREIIAMRSDYLQPGDTFEWTFSEPGKYTYVDNVVIGRVGKIVVE